MQWPLALHCDLLPSSCVVGVGSNPTFSHQGEERRVIGLRLQSQASVNGSSTLSLWSAGPFVLVPALDPVLFVRWRGWAFQHFPDTERQPSSLQGVIPFAPDYPWLRWPSEVETSVDLGSSDPMDGKWNSGL